MRRTVWSRGGWAGAWALVAAACHSEPHHELACTPGAFRACAHPCGHGIEQCLESGMAWTPCSCVILDASLPVGDAGPEAGGAGGGAEGGESGTAGGGAGGEAGAGGVGGAGVAGAAAGAEAP